MLAQLQRRINGFRAQRRTRVRQEHRGYGLTVERRPIRAIRRERIHDIGDRENACARRQTIGGPPAIVAASVEALMVQARIEGHSVEPRCALQNLEGVAWMLFGPLRTRRR